MARWISVQYVYVTNDVSVCLSLSTQFCNINTTFFYCTTFLMMWLIQETGIYTYPHSLHVGATHLLYVTALMHCLQCNVE